MPRLTDLYWAAGCVTCRAARESGAVIDRLVAVTADAWPLRVCCCRVCGTWWVTNLDSGATEPVTEERARLTLAGGPWPDRPPEPARFLIATERQPQTVRDGRVMSPSLPPRSVTGWQWHEDSATELFAIADVLGLPLPHVLEFEHIIVNGLHWFGYGMIVARDELDWNLLTERMTLTPDIGPAPWPGPVTAIGVLTGHARPRGPMEIVAVGSDSRARRRVNNRRRAAERAM